MSKCDWVMFGRQCEEEGTISKSTVGGGPWYCSVHFSQGEVTNFAKQAEATRKLKQLLNMKGLDLHNSIRVEYEKLEALEKEGKKPMPNLRKDFNNGY